MGGTGMPEEDKRVQGHTVLTKCSWNWHQWHQFKLVKEVWLSSDCVNRCALSDRPARGCDSKPGRDRAGPAVPGGWHQRLRRQRADRPPPGGSIRLPGGAAGRDPGNRGARLTFWAAHAFFSPQAVLSSRPAVDLETRNFEGKGGCGKMRDKHF